VQQNGSKVAEFYSAVSSLDRLHNTNLLDFYCRSGVLLGGIPFCPPSNSVEALNIDSDLSYNRLII